MQALNELDLPFLPAKSPEFVVDPMPFVDAARREHPWLARSEAGYIVHGYHAAQDLLLMDDKLRPALDGVIDAYGARGTPWGDFMEQMVLAKTGADHARIRASVAQAFTPRNINRYREQMREVVSGLLDEWAPRGAFDFAEFAAFFPVTVLCRVLGVSADAVPGIRHVLEVQGASFAMDRNMLPALLAGYDTLWTFADTLITEREAQGAGGDETFLDAMIAAKDRGLLDEKELRFLLMVLFPGGYDTTKNMLTLTMLMMLDRPEDWTRCARDPAFCKQVTEEMLRHTSVATPLRIVAEDFAYGDILFTEGEMLIFALALTGRDPEVYNDPMNFNPLRERETRHLAFGRGGHICIGQFLARALMEEGLHLIAQRIEHPRLAGDVSWRHFLGTWGVNTLPIRFQQGGFRS